METLESAVAEFRRLLDQVPQRLSAFSDVQAAAPAAPGHWSRKEILGHLLDSAANNHHRFVRAQIEGELRMSGYTQEMWVSSQRYQDRPWNDLIAFWTAYNRHLLHVMERVSKPRLQTPCRIGDGDPVTLEFLMTDYVVHMKHHLGQLLP